MNTAAFLLPMFWLGLLIGISFIATPVKFRAPSLSLPVALDVGRTTFAMFNKIEWGLWILLALVLVMAGLALLPACAAALLALLLVAQTAWLLPLLDRRIARIIAGETLAPSSLHIFYIAADLAKILLLGLLVWRFTP